MSIRAVFDCMIYLQAAANPAGPAMACFVRLEETGVSHDVLAEVSEVLMRPELHRKMKRLTPVTVAEFLDGIRAKARFFDPIPRAFRLPRDPDDEPYVNLAIHSEARYLVTWNERHLTYLMEDNTSEGAEFRARYPNLRIVNPPRFLELLRNDSPAPSD